MSVPRVTLLSGTLPSTSGVGGLILRDLARLYPRGRLSCVALLNAAATRVSADPDWLPRQSIQLPRTFNAEWRGGLAGRVLRPARFQLSRHLYRRCLVEQAAAFARRQGAELLWAVLDQPVVYDVAPAVADALGLPMVATVWDPPDSVCLNAGLDGISTSIAVRDFHRALGRANRCAVMNESMAREYEQLHTLRTVMMRHTVHPDECLPVTRKPNSHWPFTIGFCGSLYAVREFRALLAALDAVGWRIGNRNVRLRLLTSALDASVGPHAAVELLGWRPQREVIRILAESDVNYLPYWFDARRRNAVRLCFPSKLTTYLAAGRPVLFHGPAESAPAEFIRRHSIGACSHSPTGADLVAQLSQITELGTYETAAAAIERLVADEFSADKQVLRFAELIGVPAESLASEAAQVNSLEAVGVT